MVGAAAVAEPRRPVRLRLPRVDSRISEFAGLLRANGVRVSPAEVADAVQASALVGLDDRAGFRAALRATLVKRTRDVPAFDGLFDL